MPMNKTQIYIVNQLLKDQIALVISIYGTNVDNCIKDLKAAINQPAMDLHSFGLCIASSDGAAAALTKIRSIYDGSEDLKLNNFGDAPSILELRAHMDKFVGIFIQKLESRSRLLKGVSDHIAAIGSATAEFVDQQFLSAELEFDLAVDATMARIETNLQILTTRVGKLENQVIEIDDRMQLTLKRHEEVMKTRLYDPMLELRGRMDGMEKRMDAMEKRVDVLEKKVDAKFASVDAKLDTIITMVQKLSLTPSEKAAGADAKFFAK